MARIRVQKPKRVRKRSAPVEELARSSSSGMEVLRRLEEVLDEIDRALAAVRD